MKLLVLVKGGTAATILVAWHCLLLVMSLSSPCVAVQSSGGDSNNLVSSSSSSSSTTDCLGPPPSLSANPESKGAWLGGIWSSGRPGKNIIVPDCSSSFSLQPHRRMLWWQKNGESGNTAGSDSRWTPYTWKQFIFKRLVAGNVEMVRSSPWVMKNMVLAANIQQTSTTSPQMTKEGGGLSRGQRLRNQREGNNALKKRSSSMNNEERARRGRGDDGAAGGATTSSSKMKRFFPLPSWFPTKLVDLDEVERKVKTPYWRKRHAISLQLKPNWKLRIWNQVPEGEVCERAEAGNMVHEWRLVKEFDDKEGRMGDKRISTEAILLQNDYTVTTSAGGKGMWRFCPKVDKDNKCLYTNVYDDRVLNELGIYVKKGKGNNAYLMSYTTDVEAGRFNEGTLHVYPGNMVVGKPGESFPNLNKRDRMGIPLPPKIMGKRDVGRFTLKSPLDPPIPLAAPSIGPGGE